MKIEFDINIPEEIIEKIAKRAVQIIKENLKKDKIKLEENEFKQIEKYSITKNEIKVIENESELLSRDEMIKKLKISNSTLTRFTKERIINPVKIGKRYMFTNDDYSYLENILNAKRIFLEKEKEKNTQNKKDTEHEK